MNKMQNLKRHKIGNRESNGKFTHCTTWLSRTGSNWRRGSFNYFAIGQINEYATVYVKPIPF